MKSHFYLKKTIIIKEKERKTKLFIQIRAYIRFCELLSLQVN